jgi:hypothetical protein
MCKSQHFWNNTHIIQTAVTQSMKSVLRLLLQMRGQVELYVVQDVYIIIRIREKHITYNLAIFVNFCLSTGIFYQVLCRAFIAWSSCNIYILLIHNLNRNNFFSHFIAHFLYLNITWLKTEKLLRK